MQKITFNKDARDKLQLGVNTVADTVKITMGPLGKLVVIGTKDPEFTLDGVTVAHSIREIEDPVENIGASLVKMVSKKINDIVGDGTSTGTVLCQELLAQGLTGIENKLTAMRVKQAFEDGSKVIIDELRRMSVPVRTKREMSNVATISSRDRGLGDIIAEIYYKLGPDGLVEVEESKTLGESYEIVQGMQIDSGWVSPYLITNPDRSEAVVERPFVFITTEVLSDAQTLIPLLEAIHETESKSLIIIADDVEGEALLFLLRNKVMGKIKLSIIKAPGYGENKIDYLEDIGILTGAPVFSDSSDQKIEDIKPRSDLSSFLGRCGKIVSNKNKTIIIDGKGKKSAILARIKLLKNECNDSNGIKKAVLERRFARLSGGVAIIRTGSLSETESKEKLYRIEDAVNATKSAIQEGVVIGGGLAFVKASKVLDPIIKLATDHSYRFGLEALKDAIQKPAKQILLNAGYQPELIIDAMHKMSERNRNLGFNSLNGTYCDMIKEGVIDPLKVERVALENVVSMIGMFLITGAVIWSEKEEVKEKKQ